MTALLNERDPSEYLRADDVAMRATQRRALGYRQRHDAPGHVDVFISRLPFLVFLAHLVEDTGVPGLVPKFGRHVILSCPAAQTKFLNQIADRICGYQRGLGHCVIYLYQNSAIVRQNFIVANTRSV